MEVIIEHANDVIEYELGTSDPRSWFAFNRTLEDICVPGRQAEHIEIDPDIFQNYTCIFEPKKFDNWELGLKIAFYVVAIFMAVVGNAIVLIVIIINKRMHTRTYFYIGNLAFSDLLIGSFNMWIHLGTNITPDWPFSPLLCKMYPFIQAIALTASTGCMTVIAGERFFATVFPVKAKFSTIKKHVIIVSVVWLIAIAVAVPMLFVRDMALLIWADRHQKWCEEVWPRYVVGVNTDPMSPSLCEFEHPERKAYYTVQVIVMYFVPIGVAGVCYSFIFHALSKRQDPWQETNHILEQQQKTKRKVMRMLLIIFAVFVFCWTPQEVIVLMDVHSPTKAQAIPDAVRYTAIYVAYFNSSLNPILYAGLNESSRKGIKDLLLCKVFGTTKVTPDQTDTLRKSNTSTRPGAAQLQKKQPSLVLKGQPKLPSISEHGEVWAGPKTNDEVEDNQSRPSSTDTGCDVNESAEPYWMSVGLNSDLSFGESGLASVN